MSIILDLFNILTTNEKNVEKQYDYKNCPCDYNLKRFIYDHLDLWYVVSLICLVRLDGNVSRSNITDCVLETVGTGYLNSDSVATG